MKAHNEIQRSYVDDFMRRMDVLFEQYKEYGFKDYHRTDNRFYISSEEGNDEDCKMWTYIDGAMHLYKTFNPGAMLWFDEMPEYETPNMHCYVVGFYDENMEAKED